MSNNTNSANKLRLILGAVLVIVLIVLVATGKIDLRELLGLEADPAVTSEAAPQESEKASQQSPAETKETAETKGSSSAGAEESTAAYVTYRFRNSSLLNQHYDKHGKDMGFKNAKEYEKAASDVINNPEALHKTEKEDGDDIYYVRATNEFVVLSTDGYIRTYFLPDAGYAYYQRQ